MSAENVGKRVRFNFDFGTPNRVPVVMPVDGVIISWNDEYTRIKPFYEVFTPWRKIFRIEPKDILEFLS